MCCVVPVVDQEPKAFIGQSIVCGKVTSNINWLPVFPINRDGDNPLTVQLEIDKVSLYEGAKTTPSFAAVNTTVATYCLDESNVAGAIPVNNAGLTFQKTEALKKLPFSMFVSGTDARAGFVIPTIGRAKIQSIGIVSTGIASSR
jgi:hypothetical protein